jgi:hypothetical protein
MLPARRLGAAQNENLQRLQGVLQRGDEAHVPLGVLSHTRKARAQRALGGREIARLAEQKPQPAQHGRRDGITCGNGVVAEGLAAMDEPLVIGGGEIESPAFRIGKAVQDRLGKCPCEFEVAIPPSSLQKLEQRLGKKRVVVEVGIQMRTAVLVGCEQPSLLPQRAVDEIDGVSRGVGEIRTMQDPGGDRESPDHERVPRGQDFFIAAGPDAQRAYGKQLRAGRVDQPALIRSLERGAHTEMPAAPEIGGLIEAEAAREQRILGLAQPVTHLGGRPDVEPALVSFRVGIEARVEAALPRAHVAQHPVRGLAGNAREQLVAGDGSGRGIRAEQLGIVVQHFLEMRNGPRLVHRIAGKAAAQLIVKAAFGHTRQRKRGHGQRRGARIAQAPLDALRVRKLGRCAEAAEAAVEGTLERGARQL